MGRVSNKTEIHWYPAYHFTHGTVHVSKALLSRRSVKSRLLVENDSCMFIKDGAVRNAAAKVSSVPSGSTLATLPASSPTTAGCTHQHIVIGMPA